MYGMKASSSAAPPPASSTPAYMLSHQYQREYLIGHRVKELSLLYQYYRPCCFNLFYLQDKSRKVSKINVIILELSGTRILLFY